jgi:hypothetical protein
MLLCIYVVMCVTLLAVSAWFVGGFIDAGRGE